MDHLVEGAADSLETADSHAGGLSCFLRHAGDVGHRPGKVLGGSIDFSASGAHLVGGSCLLVDSRFYLTYCGCHLSSAACHLVACLGYLDQQGVEALRHSGNGADQCADLVFRLPVAVTSVLREELSEFPTLLAVERFPHPAGRDIFSQAHDEIERARDVQRDGNHHFRCQQHAEQTHQPSHGPGALVFGDPACQKGPQLLDCCRAEAYTRVLSGLSHSSNLLRRQGSMGLLRRPVDRRSEIGDPFCVALEQGWNALLERGTGTVEMSVFAKGRLQGVPHARDDRIE